MVARKDQYIPLEPNENNTHCSVYVQKYDVASEIAAYFGAFCVQSHDPIAKRPPQQMTSTDPNDPIADALLGESTYERLRVERYALIKRRIPRKLVYQSGLLFALALVVPIVATYPSAVQAAFPGGDPLWSSPLVLWVGVYAGGIEVGTATCLVAVAITRRRYEPSLSESQVHALLNVEDVASMFGLATGGFAILITVGFFLLGHAGVETVTAVVESAPRNPYGRTGVPIPVTAVGAAAAVSSGVVYAVGRYLARA